MTPQQQVHKAMGLPMVGGLVSAEIPLYGERYFLHETDRAVAPVDSMILVTQFGGSRVQEGPDGELRSTALPSVSLLIPASCKTHWHYSGSIDFALFYLPEQVGEVLQQLRELCVGVHAPMTFSDALVNASARQLMDELNQGAKADKGFMARLSQVMLEQVCRALQAKINSRVHPPHMQLARLNAVLSFVREHLAQDLSITQLATQAGVSPAHFRRLFQRAMGMPPHRYVMNARLVHARELLMQTDLPILHIALECGFSSQSHLTAAFKAAHAATPAEYRVQAGGSKGRS